MLVKICEYLKYDIADIAEIVPDYNVVGWKGERSKDIGFFGSEL